MIEQANASAYPRAMVVHSHDTAATDSAVMGARRFHFLTLIAELVAVHIIDRENVDLIIFPLTNRYCN